MNRYGHVDLRVPDIEAARPFYEALMPALGYTRTYHGNGWLAWATEDALPAAAYLAVTEAKDHVANANRLAFWSPDRGDVDRVAAAAVAGGARDMEGPALVPEYGPGPYYAAFFTDPAGNRFEVYNRLLPGQA